MQSEFPNRSAYTGTSRLSFILCSLSLPHSKLVKDQSGSIDYTGTTRNYSNNFGADRSFLLRNLMDSRSPFWISTEDLRKLENSEDFGVVQGSLSTDQSNQYVSTRGGLISLLPCASTPPVHHSPDIYVGAVRLTPGFL